MDAKWTGAAVVGAHDGRPDDTGAAAATTEQWRVFLRRLIDDPNGPGDHTLLKHSPATRVLRCHMDCDGVSLDVVCKQYRAVGLVRRALAIARPSRARINFNRAIRLRRCGIATAAPLAWIERKGSRRASWLITRYVPELLDLDRIALAILPRMDRAEGRGLKIALIEAIVELLARLERNRLHHRDLKASNILFTRNGDGGIGEEAWILDLDGLRERQRVWAADRMGLLRRLAASLTEYPSITRTDYARFLRAYANHIGREPGWKTLHRTIAAAARRYNRAAQGRKRHKLDGYAGD